MARDSGPSTCSRILGPYVFVIAIVSLVSALAVSALSDGAAKDNVVAVQKRVSEARRTCNVDEMGRLVEDEMMWFHSNGGTELDKGAFLAYLRNNAGNPLLCDLDEFRVDIKVVRLYGDTAVVSGDFYFKAKGRPGMAPPEKAMQVFVKRNGRWLLAANQTTKIAAAPPSAREEP